MWMLQLSGKVSVGSGSGLEVVHSSVLTALSWDGPSACEQGIFLYQMSRCNVNRSTAVSASSHFAQTGQVQGGCGTWLSHVWLRALPCHPLPREKFSDTPTLDTASPGAPSLNTVFCLSHWIVLFVAASNSLAFMEC